VKRRLAKWALVGGAALAAVFVGLVEHWQEDILRTTLDPKKPYQTYQPPPAPNYDQPAAWAAMPADPAKWTADEPPADVFFLHPTSYDGGRNWNGPLNDRASANRLARVMLPNYAGPFAQVGRIFAPRYRQASLYTALTLRDDAREARRFAYRDARAAWLTFRARYEIAKDEPARRRLAAVYLIETAIPREPTPLPPCVDRKQSACLVAYAPVAEGDDSRLEQMRRSLVFAPDGRVGPLNGRPTLCVNPVTGSLDGQATEEQHLGAANAGPKALKTPPHTEAKLVAAVCRDGLLRFQAPLAPWLQTPNRWADRWRAPAYNLFYADLEADAKARVAASLGRPDFPRSAPSIDQSVDVRTVGVRPAQ
jgi:hypothetical protein